MAMANAAAAAATTVAAPPNVAALRSRSFRPAPAVATAYPGGAARLLRFRTLPPTFVARKNLRQPKFVLSSSVEDAASVDTKVEEDSPSPPMDQPGSGREEEDDVSKQIAATKALEEQAEKSKVILDQVVHNLKDVAKLQDASKQVYAESAERAMGVLRDTTEQLREQADKARAVLLATAQQTAGKGKQNLTALAESTSDPVLKDIAQTALNAHFAESESSSSTTTTTSKRAAKIHDFCLGIPYGSILLGGGLLWFLLTGSTAALRFGVFFGGVVLALSVTSLKVWKGGHSSASYILGQGAIASLLVVREVRRFSEVQAFFPHAFMAMLSAAMLAFYTYVYVSGGNPPPKKMKAETSGAAS